MEAVKKKAIGKPLWESLQQDLQMQLDSIPIRPSISCMPHIEQALKICFESFELLQRSIVGHEFRNQQEEIDFFKLIKPAIYSNLLYYQNLYTLEINRPVGTVRDQQLYLQKELDRISRFYDENKFFYQYYKTKECYLDEKFFVRAKERTPHIRQLITRYYHPDFSAQHDEIFAAIIANERILPELEKALQAFESQQETMPKSVKLPAKTLDWTDAKSALIELIYAFKAKGSFNNGKATIKEITDYIQLIFNVELNNPSRDFQEILRRKTGYTIYLDNLKDSYLNYIDIIENKDRR